MVQHDRAEYDLGVDLGTTATVAAVREAGASAACVVPLDGRSGPAGAAGRPRPADGPAAQAVRRVTDRVARERGRAPRRVAVTHPAGWTSAHRATFAESLAEVGLLGVVLLPEPEAAAGAHAAAGRVPAGRAAAVYGLGAGAAGTCVVRGGDTGRVIALGRGAALATADVDGLGEKELAAALEPTIALVRETLEAAQVPPEELDAVLLAGTSSRLPAVTRLLADAFGRPVVADADPATLVARGAALAAGGSTPPEASGSAPPSPARPAPAAGTRTPSRTPIAAPTSSTAEPVSGPVATPTSGPVATPVPARTAAGGSDDAVTDTVAASPSPAVTDADDEPVTDTVAASPSPAATDADEPVTDTVAATPSPTAAPSLTPKATARSTPASGSGTTPRTPSRPGPQTRQSRVSRPAPSKRRGVLVGALGGGALLVAGGVLAATGGFGGASPAEAARPAGSAASAPLPAVPAAGPPRSAAPDADATRREEIRRETERSTARSARPATGTARPATPREPARATPARPAPTTRAAPPTAAPRATTEASRAPRATTTTPPPGR